MIFSNCRLYVVSPWLGSEPDGFKPKRFLLGSFPDGFGWVVREREERFIVVVAAAFRVGMHRVESLSETVFRRDCSGIGGGGGSRVNGSSSGSDDCSSCANQAGGKGSRK